MADDASRLQHLTDALFLSHFSQPAVSSTNSLEAAAPAARDSYRADLDAALQLTLRANTGKTN